MAGEIDQHSDVARKIASSRIQVWRESEDLSQTEIADALDISVRAFRNYELGVKHLPQPVRLKFIAEYQFDPVPTDSLFQELGLPPPKTSEIAESESSDRQFFWKNLRAESQRFRTANYSRPAQIMLTGRDCLYTGATFYFAMEHLSQMMGMPFGLESSDIDWMFLTSFGLIVLLIPSIIVEIPAPKIAKHVLRR